MASTYKKRNMNSKGLNLQYGTCRTISIVSPFDEILITDRLTLLLVCLNGVSNGIWTRVFGMASQRSDQAEL